MKCVGAFGRLIPDIESEEAFDTQRDLNRRIAADDIVKHQSLDNSRLEKDSVDVSCHGVLFDDVAPRRPEQPDSKVSRSRNCIAVATENTPADPVEVPSADANSAARGLAVGVPHGNESFEVVVGPTNKHTAVAVGADREVL